MPAFTCNGVEWKMLKVLGKGSFGEALLVQQVNDAARLAVIKIVNTASMTTAEKKDALQEVTVLSRLRHPNIVGFIGSFERDAKLHIVMEYCNSGDLEGLVKKQKGVHMPEDTIASLFIQTASAIRYLHERRIMHRDLKSQNIFLSQPATSGPLIVKLGDFGISTVLKHTMALAKTICGTPYYFSPELCLNRPYNNKSDIWSLGIILYEMTCLKYPFDASSMKGLMQRILQGQWGSLPQPYSPALSTLVDGMLQQRTDKRFDITKVMSSAFVQQHSVRLQASHDLTLTQRLSKGGREAEREVRDEVDPRGHAQDGNAIIVRPPSHARKGNADMDGKQQRAMLRRMEQDRLAAEKRQALEDQRRRRNIKAAQQYDHSREARSRAERMQELERLDDVRRRIEICSWEDQQKYIQEGWRIVEETQTKQQERGAWHSNTDQQVSDIRKQMEEIEQKMKDRREGRERQSELPKALHPYREPTARELANHYKNRVSEDAPWNRGRAVPVGFTKESWERQQQIAVNAERGPSTEPSHAPLPTRNELSNGQFKGSGRIDEVDVDRVLSSEAQRLQADPKFALLAMERDEQLQQEAAAREWEAHKLRIREAEAKDLVGPTNVMAPPEGEQRFRKVPRQFIPVSDLIHVAEDTPMDDVYGDVLAAMQQHSAEPIPESFGDDGWDTNDVVEEESTRKFYALPQTPPKPLPPPSIRVVKAQPPPTIPSPPPTTEVAPEVDFTQFLLDGRELNLGLPQSATLREKAKAVGSFLTDTLGGPRSFKRLRASLEAIQHANVSEAEARDMLAALQNQYGNKQGCIDLLMQLIVVEGHM